MQPLKRPAIRHRERWIITTTAAFVFATAFAMPAAAAPDAKYFNGAFCRVGFPFGGANLGSSANYSTNGSVANQHATQTLNLVCPIARDNWANTDGWDSIEVGYFDKHATDAIQCTAFSTAFGDGFLAWQEAGFSSDTAGTSWSTAGMLFDNNGAASSFANGVYFIRCLIPPASDPATPSGIAYYRVEEP